VAVWCLDAGRDRVVLGPLPTQVVDVGAVVGSRSFSAGRA